MSISIRMRIPLTQFGTSMSISIPLYVPFTSQSTNNEEDYEDYEEPRSLSTRLGMYKEMEGYVDKIFKKDGHSCLLRAMCEASANPQHDDGILGKTGTPVSVGVISDTLGDLTNFLLTGSYSAPDQNSEEGRPYLEAQAVGQVGLSVVALSNLICCS